MSEWKFGRRLGGCAACERAFADGEAHQSLLELTGDDVGRTDLCTGCFDGRAKAEPGFAERVVWWRTRHRVAEKRGLALDLETLQGLFQALAGRAERGWRELRYLLGLILVRKRRLKVTGVKRVDGVEHLVVARPRHEEQELLEVFDFAPARREELRGLLQAIFEGADLQELDPEGAGAAGEGEGGEPAPDESAEELSGERAGEADGAGELNGAEVAPAGDAVERG